MEHKQQNTQTEFSVLFDLTQTFDGLENWAFLRNQRIEINRLHEHLCWFTDPEVEPILLDGSEHEK